MKKKRVENIAFVCDYGQVRSRTMLIAAIHDSRVKYDFVFRDRKFIVGVLNYPPEEHRKNLEHIDKVVICNKPSFDSKFKHKNYPEELKEELWKLFMEEYKHKIIICEDIGEDVWQKAEHPELMDICVNWLNKHSPEILADIVTQE